MLEIQHPFDLRTIAKTGLSFIGYGGMVVTTNRISYGIVPSIEGSTPIQVVATQDGRSFHPGRGWYDGNSEDTVYVEVYSDEGQEFHGWIDRETRQLVQAG